MVFSHAVVVIRYGSHRTLAPRPPASPRGAVPSGRSPATTPFAFTLLLASSPRPAVGASWFRGQATVPRGQLTGTGLGLGGEGQLVSSTGSL